MSKPAPLPAAAAAVARLLPRPHSLGERIKEALPGTKEYKAKKAAELDTATPGRIP
jgi:hypothetical protein